MKVDLLVYFFINIPPIIAKHSSFFLFIVAERAPRLFHQEQRQRRRVSAFTRLANKTMSTMNGRSIAFTLQEIRPTRQVQVLPLTQLAAVTGPRTQAVMWGDSATVKATRFTSLNPRKREKTDFSRSRSQRKD